MKEGRTRAIAAPAIALAVMLGCASGSQPIDPSAVQARVDASERQFRELARSTIVDPDRASTFVALLDERQALIADQAQTVREHAEAMRDLNGDYDASREDFERALLRYNSKRHLSHSRFIDLMSRMKAATTEDEWKKLAGFELKELNPQTLVYASSGGT